MSNGARHGLGVLIGLLLTPVLAAGMLLGAERFSEFYRNFARTFDSGGSAAWVGALVFLVTGAVIAVLAGSRVSPVASLIPGAIFMIYGLVWVADTRWSASNLDMLPARFDLANSTISSFGVPVLIGGVLLGGSVIPSRWRAAVSARRPAPYGPGPGGPPFPPGQPAYGAPGAPPPRYGQQQQPGPPQVPSPLQAPAPGRPDRPDPGAPPAPPSPPRSSDRGRPDEGGGEWTRMYGGDR